VSDVVWLVVTTLVLVRAEDVCVLRGGAPRGPLPPPTQKGGWSSPYSRALIGDPGSPIRACGSPRALDVPMAYFLGTPPYPIRARGVPYSRRRHGQLVGAGIDVRYIAILVRCSMDDMTNKCIDAVELAVLCALDEATADEHVDLEESTPFSPLERRLMSHWINVCDTYGDLCQYTLSSIWTDVEVWVLDVGLDAAQPGLKAWFAEYRQ